MEGMTARAWGRNVEGTKSMRRNKKRPVVNLDTGQTYESVRAAAKAAGIESTTFRGALRKGVPCGGHHWRYVDDESNSKAQKEEER